MLSILLFISLFAALSLVFVPREGMSLAAMTIDDVRFNLIKRLNDGGKQEKLNVIGLPAEKFLKEGFLVGLIFGVLFFATTFKIFGSFALVFVILGVAASVYIAEMGINQKFKKWQGEMLGSIPILVDFMPAFLEFEGVTARTALENTLPFLSEPLKSELGRAVDTIKRTGRADESLMNLASRTQEPIIEAICYRLATAWDTSITPNLFIDLRDEVARAKEEAAAKATTAKKGLFAMVAVCGLFGITFLAGYPALMWIRNAVMNGFGG